MIEIILAISFIIAAIIGTIAAKIKWKISEYL